MWTWAPGRRVQRLLCRRNGRDGLVSYVTCYMKVEGYLCRVRQGSDGLLALGARQWRPCAGQLLNGRPPERLLGILYLGGVCLWVGTALLHCST